MPRMATGYWNARNTPSRARASGAIASRSLPSYSTWPAVTAYAGCPARTWASVLFPEPFGPMIACTSPVWTVRSTPVRISRPSTEAWRFLTCSSGCWLNPRSLEDFLAEAVHDHRYGVFGRETALLRVKDLILADLGRGRFVLHRGGAVAHVDVRERVCSAAIADQHRIALRVIPRLLRPLQDLHEAAVGILAAARRDALRHDRGAGVLAHMDHLGARVRLLAVVGHGHRVELADRVVAL